MDLGAWAPCTVWTPHASGPGVSQDSGFHNARAGVGAPETHKDGDHLGRAVLSTVPGT